MLAAMRRLTYLAIVAGALVNAADSPAAGTWKLSSALSILRGCPSSVTTATTLIVPANLANPSTSPRNNRMPKALATVSETQLSADGRRLTLTPANTRDCRIVYERN